VFRTNPQSGVPLYLQLIEQVRHAIEIGALKAGDQLPGIRKLARELVMNPNTVAKAYREMEHEGLVELRHGAGAFIAADQGGDAPAVRRGRLAMHRTVAGLREFGLDDGTIRRLLESELGRDDEEK
jgi:GntR family transcriptional regulator